MKKRILFSLVFIIIFIFSINVFAASVTPVEFPGNDANPSDYTPPEGCIRTTLPDSDVIGTHIYKFNSQGNLDPNGTNVLTIEVGIEPSTSYTQVLSWTWSGTYALFAIIVKGGPAFNLYEYAGSATNDTNLVSPINSSGNPADISHVSVVLCPNGEPPVPPDGDGMCCIIIIILLVIIICLLVVIVVFICKSCFYCKKHCCNKICHAHSMKPNHSCGVDERFSEE